MILPRENIENTDFKTGENIRHKIRQHFYGKSLPFK
jgi:hypothetical protein